MRAPQEKLLRFSVWKILWIPGKLKKMAELDVVMINEIEYSIDGLFQELYAEAENVSKILKTK